MKPACCFENALVIFVCVFIYLTNRVYVFMWQGSEMAQYVQTKRDLGCKASQVTLLEEGINTENRSAKEFWSLLGGKTEYRGTYIYTDTCQDLHMEHRCWDEENISHAINKPIYSAVETYRSQNFNTWPEFTHVKQSKRDYP